MMKRLGVFPGSSVGGTFAIAKEVLGGLLPKTQLSSASIRIDDRGWEELASGFFQKELWSDGGKTSKFYRLDPDIKLPGHDHPLDEECMMLSGDLFLGDILLQAGDFQLAPKGANIMASRRIAVLCSMLGALLNRFISPKILISLYYPYHAQMGNSSVKFNSFHWYFWHC